jgi:WD40 repeat protein
MSTFENRVKRMPRSKQEYVFNLPTHLARAKDLLKLDRILTDLEFVEAKISKHRTSSVIEDYDLCIAAMSNHKEESVALNMACIELLRETLQISAHILDSDPNQLTSQLLGRLLIEKTVGVKKILEHAVNSTSSVYLMPISSSLTSPRHPLYRTLTGHSDKVIRVLAGGDSNIIVSVAEDGCLKGWRLLSGEEIWSLHEMRAPMDIGPDGRHVVLATKGESFMILDIETGRAVRSVRHGFSGINGITICPDGNSVLLALKDKSIKCVGLQDGHCVFTLDGHADEVIATTVTIDGKTVISVSVDGFLKVWDLHVVRELRTIEAQAGWRHRPIVYRNGSCVVSGAWTNSVVEWDIGTGQAVHRLEGHKGFVTSVVSAHNSFVLSASWDKTIRIWDLNKGNEIRVLMGHSDWINDLAVTPDMRHVISASSDGTLKVWNLDKIVQ